MMRKNIIKTLCGLALLAELATSSSFAATPEIRHNHGQHASLKALLSSFMPKENIEVKQVKSTVILSGGVSSLEVADKAEKIAREYAGEGKVLNFLKVKDSQQVMLRVRIGEVVRENVSFGDLRSLNFNDMESRGIIKTIAEPNLVAISGEKAEFLSGGEFPVPTMQKEGSVAVDYKSYGVKIAFTPQVLAQNRVRLNVEQETSELSKEGSVNINGMKIPAISSRRAKTTIELAPGESFMIAGLVKEDMVGNHKKGSELVIAVTPYLVNPVVSKQIRLPSQNMHVPTQLEKKFLEKISKSKVSGNSGLTGPVGFIAE